MNRQEQAVPWFETFETHPERQARETAVAAGQGAIEAAAAGDALMAYVNGRGAATYAARYIAERARRRALHLSRNSR